MSASSAASGAPVSAWTFHGWRLPPEAEVRALFGSGWSIEKLARADVLASEAKFRDRGLSFLEEQVYLLNKQ